jgi:hypothetical protein
VSAKTKKRVRCTLMFIEEMNYYADNNQANRGKDGGRGKIIIEIRQDGNKWDTILVEWGEGGGRGRHELEVPLWRGGGVGWFLGLVRSEWGGWRESGGVSGSCCCWPGVHSFVALGVFSVHA